MSLAESREFIDWVIENRESWVGGALKTIQPDGHIALLDMAVALHCKRRDDDVYEDALAIRDFQEWHHTLRQGPGLRLSMSEDLVDEYFRMRPNHAQYRPVVAYWITKVSSVAQSA